MNSENQVERMLQIWVVQGEEAL